MLSSAFPVRQFIALIILTAIFVVGAKLYGQKSPAPALTPAPTGSSQMLTRALLATDKGPIEIELYDYEAPKTVDNFKRLVERGYYNGLIFHRAIKDFMIQTGDPTGTGAGGESAFGPEFGDEINGHKIEVGTVAMANRGPNTNTSQFFIVTEKAQPSLDGRYTVFGHVISGMETVRAIAGVQTDDNDRPKQDVHVQTIKLETK